MPYSDLDNPKETNQFRIGLIIALIVVIVGALMMSSCTMGYATGPNGEKTFIGAVGGKGAGKSKQLALNWDNEKSLNDVAMLGAIAIPAAQAVALGKSADKLSAVESTNAAGVAKHINTNETAVKLGEQGVTNLKTVTPPLLPK